MQVDGFSPHLDFPGLVFSIGAASNKASIYKISKTFYCLFMGIMAVQTLENNIEYSAGELQTWLSTRSRICSTVLWRRALEGKEAFEVGEFTYKLHPTASGRYLVKKIATMELIKQQRKPMSIKRAAKWTVIALGLVGICLTLIILTK